MISDREVEIYLDWSEVGIAFNTVTNLKINTNNYIVVNNYKCDVIEVSYFSGQKVSYLKVLLMFMVKFLNSVVIHWELFVMKVL